MQFDPRRARSTGGALLVLAAAVLWGTTGTSQAMAPTGANPAAIGALRLAVGGLALLAIALLRGGLGKGRWSLPATACAAGFTAAYQACFFAAVARTGVAVGTMVAIGSSPVIAGVLAYFIRGERPGLRWLVATLLAVLGCCLLVLSGGTLSAEPLGIFLAIGAGASYAIYTIAIKELLAEHSPDAVMAVVFCLGALILAPLLLSAELRWIATPRGIAVVLHLGLIATALSYLLFARGLQVVPVATAVTLSLAEPLTAGILGVLLLGEHLTPMAFTGIGFLFSGLVYLGSARPGERKNAVAAVTERQR